MSSPSLIPQRLLQTPFVDTQTGILTPFAVTNFISRLLTPAKIPQLVPGTHAQRLTFAASKTVGGSLFFESDRQVYYISANGQWVYFTGIMTAMQDNLPTDLGGFDTGFLVFVTDFAHLLQWTGTSWTWGPGENGSGYTIAFVNPPKPLAGWRKAAGSLARLR